MTPLDAEIRQAIASHGSLTFADFMRLALYHPEHGYYARRAPGPGGDYQTAPTLTPVFARLLARGLERTWTAMGAPDPFDLVEVGPGRGDLTAGIAEAAPSGLQRALRLTLVEPRPAVAALQRERLAGRPANWAGAVDDLRDIVGVVVAHEVLDNFPVHVVETTATGPRERYVVADGDRFAFESGPVSSDAVTEYVRRYAPGLEPGQLLEAGLEAVEWTRRAAATLDRGCLVVIDYGDQAPDLYRQRPHGTLIAYRAERLLDDVLAEPGTTDITAHVNFAAVTDAGRAAGLRRLLYAGQREVLFGLGLRDELDRLRDAAWSATGAEALRLHAQRSAAAALVARGGLGEHRFLVLARGIEETGLAPGA